MRTVIRHTILILMLLSRLCQAQTSGTAAVQEPTTSTSGSQFVPAQTSTTQPSQAKDSQAQPQPTPILPIVATGAFSVLGMLITGYFSYRRAKASGDSKRKAEDSVVLKEMRGLFGDMKDSLNTLSHTQEMQGLTLKNVERQVNLTNGRVTQQEKVTSDMGKVMERQAERVESHGEAIREIKATLARIQDNPRNK